MSNNSEMMMALVTNYNPWRVDYALGQWAADTAYSSNTYVLYQNKLWFCGANVPRIGVPPPDGGRWINPNDTPEYNLSTIVGVQFYAGNKIYWKQGSLNYIMITDEACINFPPKVG